MDRALSTLAIKVTYITFYMVDNFLLQLSIDGATLYNNISIIRFHNVIKGLSIYEYPQRGNDPSRLVFILVALIYIYLLSLFFKTECGQSVSQRENVFKSNINGEATDVVTVTITLIP